MHSPLSCTRTPASSFSTEMLINACYVTNTGKVRRNNEDSLLINETLVTGNMREVETVRSKGDRLVYMVADGMGGHAKGEVASSGVLTVFKDGYKDLRTAEQVGDLVLLAKESLDRMVMKDGSIFGLGTTVAGIFFSDSKAFLLNCGDSRVYESNGSVRKITRDDSLVQELVDSGTITEEEMRTHPQKNIITSAIIGDLKTGPPGYSLEKMTTVKGQKFLLCSDGLWESLGCRDMAECLHHKGIREGAECLFRKTLEAGAADNVSLILLEVAEV
ncbi:MAG: protein phosphatase 2C domain-containing protein [Candidatus Sulfobium sp.]|jgi:serine/threonine protein phosphatase PrpC